MSSLLKKKQHFFFKEPFHSYFLIFIGCLVGSIAYPLFLVPNNIAPGGLTGVATILHYLFNAPVGTTSLLLNLPLFIISYKTMGGSFVVRSIIATIIFSFMIDLIPLPPLTDDAFLGSVYGGLTLGAGMGLIMRGGATTGGSDTLARIIHRKMSFVSVGAVLFMIDFMVIIAAAFTMSSSAALYSLVCIFISSKALDLVMSGPDSSKACFIITNKADEIGKHILEEMDRGATLIDGKGLYSGAKRQILICVVSSFETITLKRIIKEEDSSSFMFVTDTHETLGEGFGPWSE